MITLLIAFFAGASAAGGLTFWLTDRRWQKQYDFLTLKAASYITGLEQLRTHADIHVASTAERALRGTL